MKIDKKDLGQIIFFELIVPILALAVLFIFNHYYNSNTPHKRAYLILLWGIILFFGYLLIKGLYNTIQAIIHNKKLSNERD